MAKRTPGKVDEFNGEVKDEQGRIERQTGEWTGDRKAQARGAVRQAEGKGQKLVGKVKNQADRLQSPIKKRPNEKRAA